MKLLLSDLAALSARTDDAEQRIHDRAVERDSECLARMHELHPMVMADDGAAQEYKQLAVERGHIARVIGLAQQRMS